MSEIQTQPLDAVDFSGGMTDNYLGGKPNQAQEMDNLHLVKFGSIGKPISREGSVVFSDPVDVDLRLNAIKAFKDHIFVFSGYKLFVSSPSAGSFTEVLGPSGSHVFVNDASYIIDPVTSLPYPYTSDSPIPTVAEWNDHLLITNEGVVNKPIKLIHNRTSGTSVFTLVAAGLPLPTGPAFNSFGAGANSYVYRLVYYQSYFAGDGNLFEDFSTPVQASITAAAAPNATAVVLGLTYPYTSNAYTPYDTANIKVKVYRTTNAGTVFYYVGQANWNAPTFTDTMSDATLILQPTLYTEGGVVENDEPQPARTLHIIGDTAYYGAIYSGEGFNEIRQSVPGDIDSVPETFSVTLQDEVIGLTSFKSILIALCRNSAYRIDGQFDLLGRGGMVATKISDTSSCVHGQSAVQTLMGVFWCGVDGFYWSDGYNVKRINDHLVQTHKNWTATDAQQRKIQGKYDHRNRRVYWTIQSTEALYGDCDLIAVLHLDFGVTEESTFSTLSGGDQFGVTNFQPTAVEFYNDTTGDTPDPTTWFRGDPRGYILQHRSDTRSDPVVDESVAAALWTKTQPVIYDYTTISSNMGSSFIRKFVPRISAAFKHLSNLSVQILSINDDSRLTEELKPIRHRDGLIWGVDDATLWGVDDDILWGRDKLVNEWRRFPASSLRCDYKQIKFTNAWVAIASSDDYATCDVAASGLGTNTHVATLNDVSGLITWPSDLYTYKIALQTDNYVTEYDILSSSGQTLTYLDPANPTFTATASKWVIRGYPKDEIFQLISYTIHYAYLGKTQTFYRTSSTGEVGS